MRFDANKDGVSVHAISGTYVVMLAMDATDQAKNGLLGFAIERTDRTENQQYWLQGMRTFKSVLPNPPEGSLTSTHEHPIQDFLWSDFTAKPNHDYVYKIVPVRGQPKKLEYGTPVEVEVKTENESEGEHAVYFNRGVIGSQAYARKFHNADPQKLTGAEKTAAYTWLSRGLYEAMRDFVQQAKSPRFGLRAAVYEFDYEPIIQEFGNALKKCRNVKIIFDARIASGKKGQQMKLRVDNVKKLLKKYKLDAKGVAIPRTQSPNFIAHNKFIVLLDNNKPVAVWTGSTNFTESGIYGQSNVGHIVRDEAVATTYLKYWERLQKDPTAPALSGENMQADPDLVGFPPPAGVHAIFSPRKKNAKKQSMLDWYGASMGKAESVMCFTAAFGVNKVFLQVLGGKTSSKDDLRYLFLEKWGVNKKLAADAEAALSKNASNQVAIGGFLQGDVLHNYLMDRWAKERSNSLSTNVRFTHTKYMLIDPLGKDPVVISGSANFSDASTLSNDENMLIVRGDTRIADIYLGEFMRLWQHYRFRSIVNVKADESGNADGYEPNYLAEDDSWTSGFYKAGNIKYRRRVSFAVGSQAPKPKPTHVRHAVAGQP